MVHFLAVKKHVGVHFDLHCQDLDLLCCYFELVGLAVELEAIDGLEAEGSLGGGTGLT